MKFPQHVVLAAVIMSLATLTQGAADRGDDALVSVPGGLLGRSLLEVAQLTGSGASSADGAGGSANMGARRLLRGPDIKPDTPSKPADPKTATSGSTPYERTMAYVAKVEQERAKAPASSGGSPSGGSGNSGTAAADTAGSGASSADGAGGSANTGARRLLRGPDIKPDTPSKPADPKTATSGSTPYERTMAYVAKVEQERAKAPASSGGSSSGGSGNSGTAAADTAGSGASSADGAGGSANTGARRLLRGPDIKPDTPSKPADPKTATSGSTPYERTMAYAAKVEQERAKAPASSAASPSSSAASPSSSAASPSGGK